MDLSLKGAQQTTWEEAQDLINILRIWGVTYLVGDDNSTSHTDNTGDHSPYAALIARLAQCSYPRIRDATISLFLLHPELVPAVVEAITVNNAAISEQIITLVLATLYLQRLWSIRLMLAFGHRSAFPEYPFAPLWRNRALPSPACHDGLWGLEALQQAEQRRTGLPFNYRADWQNQINHLLLQEEAYRRPLLVPLLMSFKTRHTIRSVMI